MEQQQNNSHCTQQVPYRFIQVRYTRLGHLYFITMILAGLCLSSIGKAQAVLPVYEKKVFVSNGDSLLYRIMYPANFDKSKTYPLVYFLHGAGERGSNNEAQLVHGGKLFADPVVRKEFPAVVVFPQCPKDSYWSNVKIVRNDQGTRTFHFIDPDTAAPSEAMKMAIELLEDISSKKYIDKRRIYVGGLSMGGMGTFEIVARKPNTFAAAFAICGGGYPGAASSYAEHTDFWIFHGEKDDVVPPENSKRMYKAILEAGGKPKLTLYPEANHNSWDSAFAEPKLLPWLFSKHK